MKKIITTIVLIIIAIFAAGFLIINNITHTSGGTINTYLAANLQLNKILNPKKFNKNDLKEVRKYSNGIISKWGEKTIEFSNIKNEVAEINSRKVPIRIYTPKKDKNLPIIIYSHGGSWFEGSIETSDNICRKISKNTGAIVISSEYSLAPEKPFPAAIEDVYSVLQWSYKNANQISGDKKRISLAGDSAGANISAAVSTMARNKKGPDIKCQVLIYPSTNIAELNTKSWGDFQNRLNISSEEMEQYISYYVPKKEERKNPYASPLLAKDFKGLPDTLIITAEIDPLRDEAEKYGDKLREAGVKVNSKQFKGVTHGFITMDKITNQANAALQEVYSYIEKELGK